MNNNRFYTPEEIRPLYSEIIPAYQDAFAGEPWYEVSKCEDKRQRCIGGLSALAVGQTCQPCNEQMKRPAYEADELITGFETLAQTRPTTWYAEQTESGLAYAAIAWRATPDIIAQEKYADTPMMQKWMSDQLQDKEIVWIDEVFANKKVRTKGNLTNFGSTCEGFKERLDADTVAFRTINARLVAAAERDYGTQAAIFYRENSIQKTPSVPDRREFVIITPNKEETK